MWLTANSLQPPQLFLSTPPTTTTTSKNLTFITNTRTSFSLLCLCSPNPNTSTTTTTPPPPKKRNRYRRLYPGETTGITEEMRFVAMRLRNTNATSTTNEKQEQQEEDEESSNGHDSDAWHPSIQGFLRYLVDTKLVFNTVERIVDDSDHVSYAYFRKTGLERSEGIAKDLEGFEQQGLAIPNPRSPGLTYSKYLEELAERSPPLFLSHFYNIYFSHIAGGQVIAKKVSEKLLEGKELELYRWEDDPAELLKGVRENLNMLAEHWTRDDKNKCLRETTKSFRYLGQIVRHIIL
ncbi:putative inactive heme oxygenase 2, chloroplastic [Stylosanthes scabra]|uniref:Inactive heme oxygenase 2, chloroplastic n=1 Tax=Stylosanthes scabra TaxID=79078 RepID=A0ABU6Q5L9_9FABA|nr:putative inactive heme oxygenase 2, chloroplastic [Stylosanthes scabra]